LYDGHGAQWCRNSRSADYTWYTPRRPNDCAEGRVRWYSVHMVLAQFAAASALAARCQQVLVEPYINVISGLQEPSSGSKAKEGQHFRTPSMKMRDMKRHKKSSDWINSSPHQTYQPVVSPTGRWRRPFSSITPCLEFSLIPTFSSAGHATNTLPYFWQTWSCLASK
jgi:hypothetical protein